MLYFHNVRIPNNYFRILVEQLDLSDYLHSFLTNKVKSKQNPVKDESKSKDTPISSEIPTLLNLKLPILNDPNYFGQSFIKYEETEDNTKKSGNKGKSKNSKDNKNSDSSTSAKSKNSSKGASSSEISKNNNIPKTAPRLPFKLPNFDVTKLTLIHSRPATDPAIWITLIENVKVYMCLIPVNMDILESSDSTMTPPLIPLLRIYNNDMVNGTLLLTAGGVESEQNRSIILSLESKRVRIRKHTNGLCGTWIPLNRARELARTCSLDSKLSVFLSDNLRDYFAYNENVPTIPLPLPLGNPLLDINKSMAVAALSSLNATAAVTTAASTSTTTATTTSSTTSSTKANTKANATTGKTKEIPISMKAPNPFQTALNLLNSNRLLLNKGNILGNNPLFSNPSALSLLFKQFPFSPMSLPTGTTPKISIASNSKKNNNNSQSQKTQTTKSSTPSTTTTTASTTTTTTATTTAAAVTDAAAIAASLTTTAAAPDFTTIPTLPLTFPSIAATAPLSTTSTTDPAGFQLAFENSVDQIGKNTKPSSISQLMKTTNKMKKMKRMPVRITKKENAMLNSTLASLTNEKFQNSFLSVSPDKNNKELTVNNDNSNSSNDSEEENDQNLLFLSSSSSSENEDDKNEEVAFLSRDGYMSEVQDNKNSDDENDNSNEENLDKDDDDEDDDDEDDEEESYEENEYDEMEGTEYDEDGESEGSILSSNSDKNIINVVDDDSSEGYKSDYDNNLENMWYLKPRISGGGKTKRLNSKKKLTTEKSSHKKSTSNKNSESHSRKKKKIINSSSNTKLILKQFPEFYSSSTPPPPSKKKKSKSKKSNKKIEIVSKSEEEEESDISIVSEHSSYIDVNSSDDNNELFDPINIINDNNDEDEDFSIDVTSSDIKTGNGKKIIIRKPSNSSTNSKKAKSDNNVTSSDKKIKSITLELSNKNGKGTKRQKKNSVSKKQSEQSELEDKKNTVVNVEPILPLSINIKRKRVTKKSSTTLTSDSPQSTASSKMVSEMNNSNDNDSDSSIINIDDSSNFNNSTNGQSSPSQVSSSVKIPSAISEEEKIRAAIMSNINLTQKIEPIPVAASTSTSTSTTSSLATSTKLTKSKKSKISSTTKPPSTENLSPSILKAIKNSQNLALLPEFQAEMKAPSKKRSKKQSFNETLSLINNPFLFPTAIPPVTNPTSTPKSKLVNIKPKDNHNHNQIYPNYNLLNVSKPIILPKFPIPILPNQGTKPPYNLLDTSSTFPNQFDFTPANLSKAAAELLSGSALPLDNKLASSFAAASTSTAIPSTATSSIDTTTSSTLPATLQSLANNLVFQSIPANIMASTLPKPNISQAQIQSLRKRTKNLKNKENVEEDDEEIDIVSDDGFDDFLISNHPF
ncbi:hypothetical protein PIROE2DRAFT_6381 [Piromyces sp. E2]|nr:hypothetical protein PIROE2DRAFT_6381 [Piromyces sp. E2]|eukprot:OUM66431.1 hypothetical protein PIROE2DRAFT_6381 [Piromyces sp. E2]